MARWLSSLFAARFCGCALAQAEVLAPEDTT